VGAAVKSMLAGIAACLVATSLALPAQGQTKCQRYRLASLAMSVDRAGRPTVQAKVNGQDIPFLVDTGGLDSELAYETVEKLKLRKMPLEVYARTYNAYGQAAIYKTVADTFSIGAMAGTAWPFLVASEHDPAMGSSAGVGGLLGPDILSKYDVEFDFAAGKFNIFAHNECSGRVAYWTMQPFVAIPFHMDGYHIFAPAKLDGKTVDVLIDSGASVSVMSSNSAEEHGIDKSKLKRVEGAIGDDEYYTYPFKVLDLNGLTIVNPDVVVMPEKTAALHNLQEPNPVVVLGVNVLRQLHLYIAYREKVLYLTQADAR
jgi:predicted aspartyl protease